MIGDWVFNNLGKCVLLLAGLMFALLVLAVIGESANRADFMAECLQDRKQYECTAMWKSSQPQTTFIPVMIPVR